MERRPPIELREYQTLEAVALSDSEADALRSLTEDKLAVHMTSGVPGHYDLTPSSWIGTVDLAGVQVLIRPKIPIDRVMFLISYALDPVRWKHHIRPEFGARDTLIEAMVPGFLAHLERALRPGILQGYRPEEDALQTVRGRIRFGDQIRTRYGIAPPIEVRFDEFTEDIEINRLLRAALHRLTRLRIRDGDNRQAIRRFSAALGKVGLIEYDRRKLPEFHFTRLNQRYRESVGVARLILTNTATELEGGSVRGSAFLVDMNDVFERFVWVALRESLKLSDRQFPLGAKGRKLYLDEARNVKLEPDLSWWEDGQCVWVGDAKYKRLNVKGVKHPDLYQMLSYTIATGLPTGLLIYAAGEGEPRKHVVSNAPKTLEVVNLGVSGTPAEILHQMDWLTQKIKATRVRPDRMAV